MWSNTDKLPNDKRPLQATTPVQGTAFPQASSYPVLSKRPVPSPATVRNDVIEAQDGEHNGWQHGGHAEHRPGVTFPQQSAKAAQGLPPGPFHDRFLFDGTRDAQSRF
jgi:hypothetical protein